MTRAFFLVDASVVVPFEFLRLPFAALVAYLWFAEVPSVWTWLGGAVIFGATAYIAEREARVGRVRAERECQLTSTVMAPMTAHIWAGLRLPEKAKFILSGSSSGLS